MSKLITPLLGLALAVWIIGWAWWFSKNYCGTAVVTPSTPELSISDGDFKTNSLETFSFGLSDNVPLIPEATEGSIEKTAQYLSENPNRNLKLSGLFGSYEENPTVWENLGIARAESLKEKLVEFGASAEQIQTTGIRVDNSVFKNERMDGGVWFTFTDKPEEPEIIEEEPEITDYKAPFEGYTVYYKTSEYMLDYNNQPLFDYLKSLRRYLKANPDRKVIITGHTDNVGNRRTNEKLSNARARKVRRYLVDTGVNRSQRCNRN